MKPKTSGTYVLTLLILIYVCNNLDRHIISILAEPIKQDLKLSDTQLGLLTGLAFALFYTFFGIPAGWLADRFGRIRVLFLAATIWSICSAAGALATKFTHLALSRAGVGIGEAGGAAPSYSLISSFFPPERRGGAIGLLHLGSPISTFIGTFAATWIATHYGWRAALLAVSLPGVLVALALWLTVKEPQAPEGQAAQPPLLSAVSGYFRDPIFRNLAITAGMSSFTSFALAAWLPAFLMRIKGMSLQEVGLWFGPVYAVAFGLGLWGGGYLADRFAPRGAQYYAAIPLAGLLTAAPFLALALAAPDWRIALAVAFVPVAAIGLFLAPAVTCVQNRSPNQSRSVNGALFLFVNNLVGAGFGPLYVGWISDRAREFAWAPLGLAPLTIGLAACIPILLIAATLQARNMRLLRRDAALGDVIAVAV